jgi:hypothetical protein
VKKTIRGILIEGDEAILELIRNMIKIRDKKILEKWLGDH